MNGIEVLALVAKATYKEIHPYEMKQSICLRDAMQLIDMARPIAIESQHIFLVSPTIQFDQLQTLSKAENKTFTFVSFLNWRTFNL